MNSIHELESIFVALQSLAEKLGRKDMIVPLQRLREKNIRREWHLVVIGETSTGKSCLINSLVDENILPEQSAPTTGQIVVVQTDSGMDESRFIGLSHDGNQVGLSRNDFENACTGDESWISLRAELSQSTSLPKGVVIVDTPGFNSCIEKHSEILSEYLPQADAILFLTSHRRGITEQDAAFLDITMKSIGRDNLDRVLCAANFCPTLESDARIKTMQKQIARHLGAEIDLHLISSDNSQPRRLRADSLWLDLTATLEKMDLEKTVTRNLMGLAEGITTILADSLEVFEQAASAEESELNQLESYLVQLQTDQKNALLTIQTYRDRLLKIVDVVVRDGIKHISCKAWSEIDSSSRFTDAGACGSYLRGHFIDNEVNMIKLDAGRQIEIIFEELAEKLEELAGRVYTPTSPAVRVSESGPGSALGKMRDQAVKYGSGKVAAWYLRKLGGAVGEQAGLLNLARTGVRRVGEVFGKRFSRELYTKVIPRVLRDMGIRSSGAINVFSYVVMEITAKIYHFATWKNSLKAAVDRTLGVAVTDEPILDQLKKQVPFFRDKSEPVITRLERAFNKAIDEGITETIELVEADFCARINTRSEALKIRREKPDSACAILSEIRSELENVADKLNNMEDKESLA